MTPYLKDTFYYSKTTGGFYREDVHGSDMPADVVEVSNEEHEALFLAQDAGEEIKPDANGKPVAVPQPPLTPADVIRNTNNAARTEIRAINAEGTGLILTYLATLTGADLADIRALEARAVIERGKIT